MIKFRENEAERERWGRRRETERMQGVGTWADLCFEWPEKGLRFGAPRSRL